MVRCKQKQRNFAPVHGASATGGGKTKYVNKVKQGICQHRERVMVTPKTVTLQRNMAAVPRAPHKIKAFGAMLLGGIVHCDSITQ